MVCNEIKIIKCIINSKYVALASPYLKQQLSIYLVKIYTIIKFL